MRRFATRVVLLVVLSTLGIAKQASAVTGGTPNPDPSADGVVMILTNDSQCSGAVIAPTVVLTAAHCLADPMASNYTVLGGLNPFQTSLFSIAASEVHQHPNFDSNTITHDVGVLILESAAPATPLPWFATDQGFYTIGTQVGILGYGGTGPSGSDAGIRRSGVTAVAEVSAGQFLTNNTTGPGMCVGDSGGPAVTTDEITSGTIIGVSAFGDPDCAQFSAFERTDANADFIGLYAPEPNAVASVEIAVGALFVLARRRG